MTQEELETAIRALITRILDGDTSVNLEDIMELINENR